MEWFTKIPTEIVYVAVAAAGGIARYLQHYLNGSPFSWSRMIAHAGVACFSGYMFYSFSIDILGFPESTAAVFTGLGGWMGAEALKLLEDTLSKWINNKK